MINDKIITSPEQTEHFLQRELLPSQPDLAQRTADEPSIWPNKLKQGPQPPCPPNGPVTAFDFPDGRKLFLKSEKQKTFFQAMDQHPLVIALGPAGTGKTFLAIAKALLLLLNQQIEKVILTRPVVEAGESLGYLPGDIAQKFSPYLAPFFDNFSLIADREQINEMIKAGIIEICPLAYMRGRTLNKAFIVLDEAQNATYAQTKMFLTRLGTSSRMVLTGDLTQIDLKEKKHSGLPLLEKIFKNNSGIKFIKFTKQDVCRHPLVEEIIQAYVKYEKNT